MTFTKPGDLLEWYSRFLSFRYHIAHAPPFITPLGREVASLSSPRGRAFRTTLFGDCGITIRLRVLTLNPNYAYKLKDKP